MSNDLNTEVVPSVTPDNTRPAKRCSDYDSECVEVRDHLACWKGGLRCHRGEWTQTPPADGYCPFLMGMEKP